MDRPSLFSLACAHTKIVKQDKCAVNVSTVLENNPNFARNIGGVTILWYRVRLLAKKLQFLWHDARYDQRNLLLFNIRMLHKRFQLIPKSMTLDDTGRPFSDIKTKTYLSVSQLHIWTFELAATTVGLAHAFEHFHTVASTWLHCFQSWRQHSFLTLSIRRPAICQHRGTSKRETEKESAQSVH